MSRRVRGWELVGQNFGEFGCTEWSKKHSCQVLGMADWNIAQCTVLGWAAEQFESESWNLAVMFLHNSVNLQNSCVAVFFPHPLKCNVSALSVCIISLRFWLRRPVSSRLCIVSLHHPSIHPSSFLWRRNNNEYPSFNCSIRHGDNWKRERRVESSWVKEVGLQHSSRVRDTERGTITSQKYQMNVY